MRTRKDTTTPPPEQYLKTPNWRYGVELQQNRRSAVTWLSSTAPPEALFNPASRDNAEVMTPDSLATQPGAAPQLGPEVFFPAIIPPHLARRCPTDSRLLAIRAQLKELEALEEAKSDVTMAQSSLTMNQERAAMQLEEDLFTPEKIYLLPAENSVFTSEMRKVAQYFGLLIHELPRSLAVNYLRDYFIVDGRGTPIFPCDRLVQFINSNDTLASRINPSLLVSMHQHFGNAVSSTVNRSLALYDLRGANTILVKDKCGKRKILVGKNQLQNTRQFIGVSAEHSNEATYQNKIAEIWGVDATDVILLPQLPGARLDTMLTYLEKGKVLLHNNSAYNWWYGWDSSIPSPRKPTDMILRQRHVEKCESTVAHDENAEEIKKILWASGFEVLECLDASLIGGIAGRGANNRKFYLLNRPQVSSTDLNIFINLLKYYNIQVIVINAELESGSLWQNTNYLLRLRWPT